MILLRITDSPMLLKTLPENRLQLRVGELDVLLLVSQEYVVEVPTVQDKLPSVTCAVVDACTTQLKLGEDGTVA